MRYTSDKAVEHQHHADDHHQHLGGGEGVQNDEHAQRQSHEDRIRDMPHFSNPARLMFRDACRSMMPWMTISAPTTYWSSAMTLEGFRHHPYADEQQHYAQQQLRLQHGHPLLRAK
jgi:hypothetical protein